MELYGNWQTRFWSKSASFIVNNHFSLCVPHPHTCRRAAVAARPIRSDPALSACSESKETVLTIRWRIDPVGGVGTEDLPKPEKGDNLSSVLRVLTRVCLAATWAFVFFVLLVGSCSHLLDCLFPQGPFHILQSEPDKAAHANNRNPAGSNVSLNASD
jgi:hypothetical protein